MKLTMPYPPSTNRMWRVFRGRAVKSAEAIGYQRNAKLLALASGGFVAFQGPVVVSVDVFRPRRRGDLDNTLKVLLDSLKGIAFLDDDQVVEIHARRFEDKGNPRVEVEVKQEEQS